MNVWKKASTIATILGLMLLATNTARAAEAADGIFDKDELLTTVTKVGYRAGISTLSVVITGLDASGNTVTLSLQNAYSTDVALSNLIEDCSKKASLAMASPTKFSFGFQFDEFGTGTSSATYLTNLTNSSNRSYSVYRINTRYSYEVECYLTPVSSGS